MATEILLPRLGQGMESGTIVRWLKSEGEALAKGEPLYELDTEKVTQEVEADVEGTLLRILAREGQEVPVGQAVALVGDPSEVDALPADGASPSVGAAAVDPGLATSAEAPAPAPEREEERSRGRADASEAAGARAPSTDGAAASSTPPETPAAAPAARGSGTRLKASPLAKRMARARGIELSSLSGTGPDGRIVVADVERAAAAAAAAPAAPPAEAAEAAPVAAPGAAVERVPLTSMRRVIARRMSEAWQAPHFVVSMSVDMRRAVELRERLLADVADGAVRPTFSDVVTKLVAVALVRHPALNAHYAGDEVLLHPSANVGLAIAVEGGLVVPVIQGCERRSIAEIASARSDLVERARAGKLAAADFDSGTFTISNLGMYGVESFMAVLNPPQVAILAVGAIEDKVVAEGGEVVVRPRLELSLSCDHRAVDGATGSEFLRTVKRLLEEPLRAL